MKRHLRFKFACEIFLGIDGYPPDIMDFPKSNSIKAWKLLYLPKSVQDVDFLYGLYFAHQAFQWKLVPSCFHIPKYISDDVQTATELIRQKQRESERLAQLSLVTGQKWT